jgi:hypothetical protein
MGSTIVRTSARFKRWLMRLCFHHNNQISVVIEPAHSLIYARLRSAIDGLDDGEFTEGHELDRKECRRR